MSNVMANPNELNEYLISQANPHANFHSSSTDQVDLLFQLSNLVKLNEYLPDHRHRPKALGLTERLVLSKVTKVKNNSKNLMSAMHWSS